MKLVIVSVQAEYAELVADIVEQHQARHYFVFPRVHGSDSAGYHDASQVHPGSLAALHIRIADDNVMPLLEALERFRLDKRAHGHLEAQVLNVEQQMGPDSPLQGR